MDAEVRSTTEKTILVLSGIMLVIGYCGSPLIMRLYFVHGGSRVWLSTWLETGGWPIMLIPLTVSYFYRRKTEGGGAPIALMKLQTFVMVAILGVFTGLANYLYAFGVGHLPVSTSALISSTQLVFTAFFAFLIVKQKFTSHTINAIVLLTVGAVLLGIHAGSDIPRGESNKMYILGFILTIGAAASTGFLYPLIEMVYKLTNQAISFTFVMEVQMVISFFSTVFATVGMLINNDFKVIPREARGFELGETRYYVILVWSAIIWQLTIMGLIGTLFSTSSLVTGIIITVLLPVSEVLAVIFYHEKFEAEKGVALALSLWGFVSHFYGEFKSSKKKSEIEEIHMAQKTQDLAA